MPDPQPCGRPGILTAPELEACLRVVRACLRPIQCLTVSEWSAEDQRAYVSLRSCRYVEEDVGGIGRASWRWTFTRATAAGLAWLRQIEARR